MKVESAGWVGLLLAGRFEVTSKLGEGGMGLVYRATDRKTGQQVVVKAPLASQLEQQGGAERFLREIRSQMQLPHRNIVPVLEVGEHDGIPFAVMPYLGGGSLKDALPVGPDGKRGPLAPVVLRAWLADIAAALDHVHRAGFMHRDVKPANILFDDQGQAYLSDFGVVKALAAAEAGRRQTMALTGTGLVLGTPEYMAPELIMGNPCDGRVDQFALAVAVYEVLSGRVPVEGPNPAAVLVKLVSEPLIPLEKANARVSGDLAAAVHRGMEKEPGQRFPDCSSFAHAVLEAIPAAPTEAVEQRAAAVQQPAGVAGLVVACPVCAARLKTTPSLAGKLVKCRACGERIRIPGPEPLSGERPAVRPPGETRNGGVARPAVVAPEAEPLLLEAVVTPEWIEDVDDEPNRRERRRRRERPERERGGKGARMLLAVGGIAVLAAAGVFAFVLSKGDKKPDTAPAVNVAADTKTQAPAEAKEAAPAPRLQPVAGLSLYAGESKEVPLAIDRHGYGGQVTVTASVPEGQLSAEPLKVPAAEDRAVLRLTAGDRAAVGSYRVRLSAAFGGARSDEEFLVRIQKPALQLGVDPPPTLKAGGSAGAMPVKVTRVGCAGRPVEVELKGLPAEAFGETAKGLTLPPGQDAGDWRLSAPASSAGGIFRATVAASIPALDLRVEEPVRVEVEPLRLRLKAIDRAALAPGRAAIVSVAVDRDGFVGPLELQVDKLPAGVVAEAASIPDGASETALTLIGTPEAKEGSANAQVALRSGKTPIGAPGALLVTVAGREGLLRMFPGGGRGAALNPEGTRVGIVTDEGSSAKVFDINTGKELFSLRRQGSVLRSIGLGAEGRRVVTATDAGMQISDNGRELAALAGHREPRFNAFGDRVISYKDDKTVWVHEVGATEVSVLKTLKAALPIHGIASNPAGDLIAVRQGEFGAVRVLDVPKGKEAAVLPKPAGSTAEAIFNPDGKLLLTREGSGGGSVRVWDALTGARVFAAPGAYVAAGFASRGTQLVAVDGNHHVSVWKLPGGEAVASYDMGTADKTILSPDGSRSAAGSCGRVRVYDTATGTLLFTLVNPSGAVARLAFSANGRRLLATDPAGKAVTLWSVEE